MSKSCSEVNSLQIGNFKEKWAFSKVRLYDGRVSVTYIRVYSRRFVTTTLLRREY